MLSLTLKEKIIAATVGTIAVGSGSCLAYRFLKKSQFKKECAATLESALNRSPEEMIETAFEFEEIGIKTVKYIPQALPESIEEERNGVVYETFSYVNEWEKELERLQDWVRQYPKKAKITEFNSESHSFTFEEKVKKEWTKRVVSYDSDNFVVRDLDVDQSRDGLLLDACLAFKGELPVKYEFCADSYKIEFVDRKQYFAGFAFAFEEGVVAFSSPVGHFRFSCDEVKKEQE